MGVRELDLNKKRHSSYYLSDAYAFKNALYYKELGLRWITPPKPPIYLLASCGPLRGTSALEYDA